jgi:hypothetical protein
MKTIINWDSGKFLFATLAATLLTLLATAASAQSDVSILYHEPLMPLTIERSEKRETTRLVFDAFGRRFVLLVDESTLGASTPGIELIKARIENMPDAWARLTVRAGVISGIIQDTSDTYVIEPRAMVADSLLTTNDRSSSASIIYRLADVLVPHGLLSCGTIHSGERVNGKDAFAELTAELDSAVEKSDEIDRATIGIIADSHLYERLDFDTQAMVEQMFQTVAGIYSEQLGVEIAPLSYLVSTDREQDPVSEERDGSKLLDELGNWRRINQSDMALTHLVTNRDLLNDTGASIAGISFLGTPGRSGVCDARTGVSISEWIGSGMTALVIAHEIGHNFGAPHDGEPSLPGEPDNACASEPQDTYLMSPMLRGSRTNEFSQCSVEQIRKVMSAANCLRPPSQLQATVPTSGGGGALNWICLAALVSMGFGGRRKSAPKHS